MQNLILGGVLGGLFKIQGCFVPQKSIFDPFGKKLPARMVTVKKRMGFVRSMLDQMLRTLLVVLDQQVMR